MTDTIKRDLVDEYLNLALAEFKEKATDLVSFHGDDLTLLQIRNLRNSIFTKHVREFAMQERDSLSAGLFSSSFSHFVERFIESIDDAVLNDFPVFE